MTTEEEIRNMSPEELAEFQKKNCIFCQIIDGKVQAKKISENANALSFLDINPANPGHALIIPQEHFSIMPQIPDEIIGDIFDEAARISMMAIQNLKATGTNIFVANGIVAGQKAQHLIVNVIPRKDDDGLVCFNIPENEINEDDFFRTHSKLVKAVNTKFGLDQKYEDTQESENKPASNNNSNNNNNDDENNNGKEDIDLNEISSLL